MRQILKALLVSSAALALALPAAAQAPAKRLVRIHTAANQGNYQGTVID